MNLSAGRASARTLRYTLNIVHAIRPTEAKGKTSATLNLTRRPPMAPPRADDEASEGKHKRRKIEGGETECLLEIKQRKAAVCSHHGLPRQPGGALQKAPLAHSS